MDPQQAAIARADFESTWNQLNLIRSIGSTVTAICCAVALFVLARDARPDDRHRGNSTRSASDDVS